MKKTGGGGDGAVGIETGHGGGSGIDVGDAGAGAGPHRPAATADWQPRGSKDPDAPRSLQATWSSQVRTACRGTCADDKPRECDVCARTGMLTGDSTTMLGMLLLPEPGRC